MWTVLRMGEEGGRMRLRMCAHAGFPSRDDALPACARAHASVRALGDPGLRRLTPDAARGVRRAVVARAARSSARIAMVVCGRWRRVVCWGGTAGGRAVGRGLGGRQAEPARLERGEGGKERGGETVTETDRGMGGEERRGGGRGKREILGRQRGGGGGDAQKEGESYRPGWGGGVRYEGGHWERCMMGIRSAFQTNSD
jgi:hypothetical protein